ncbi:hypothetical protein BC834DRAFT_968530 [Gloeopeniophorella convolvens]|nr:hypothetical protein BC834DRAFT_968530 [Gloeopeniophorella convolvens]
MALSLVPPVQPSSPPRTSRRSAFGLSFLPLTPISSIPSTPGTFSSDDWFQQPRPSTPDPIPGSASVSLYSTPLTAPLSPSALPEWKAVPPTPPAFLPLSPPSNPPVRRRRTHPRPASAVLSAARSTGAHRRLSLPARAVHAAAATMSPPSAFRHHERRSSLGGAARRLFHIENDDAGSDDGDDQSIAPDVHGAGPAGDDPGPKRSVSGRHHALLELLATERGYLADLRALVTVYLEQLPMLLAPKVITLPLLSPSYSATFALGRPEDVYKEKDRDRDREKRALLSDAELRAVRRNAAQLLELHETLLSTLTDAVRASGWVAGMNALEGSGEYGPVPSGADEQDAEERFERALRAVAALFTEQAASFNVYEVFCAEHPGAVEVVHGLQRKRPIEWDAFERRCASLITKNPTHTDYSPPEEGGGTGKLRDENSDPKEGRPYDPNDDKSGQPGEPSPARQDSISSLNTNPLILRGGARSNLDLKQMPAAASKDAKKKENPAERGTRPRLHFMDYLIKPVQRICKYPLLLKTLILERESLSPVGVDEYVISARQAMAGVAALVDHANFTHLRVQQTSRIGARLAAPAPVLAFVRTLSPCVLAGPLDVVQVPALKAKYFAAFLYEGGFLALAKVTRGPRYELRYWFSLDGFRLYDAEDDDPLLPHSFRLCDQMHEFEMAASCPGEKQVWMNAINTCLAVTPTWPAGTAPSSLDKSPTADTHSPTEGSASPLPTIQSIPEIESPQPQSSPSPSPVRTQRPSLRAEVPHARGFSEPPPSRRESTASLKSIFGSAIDADAVMVTRISPQARSTIDALLEDVFSPTCHQARSYAEAHSEALFHVAPTFGAAARSRLTKRESVLVRRRRSYIDLVDEPQGAKSARKVPIKAPPALALECITNAGRDVTIPLVHSPDSLLDSPTVVSQCSSASGSRGGSSSASPLAGVLELPLALSDGHSPSNTSSKSPGATPADLLDVHGTLPKRSRSLIDNFRGFILPNSSPPVRTLSVSRISILPATTSSSSATFTPQRRRWRESLRHRSQSSPSVPVDVIDPAAEAAIARLRPETSAMVAIADAQRHSWNLDELGGGSSSPFSSESGSTRRRSFFNTASSRGPPATTTSRTMLRSILSSLSRSPSSTNVSQDYGS